MNKRFAPMISGLVFSLLVSLSGGCVPFDSTYMQKKDQVKNLAEGQSGISSSPSASFKLSSSTIPSGGKIPLNNASLSVTNGRNLSPPLTWSNPPAGTNSFAVVLEEIETGSKLHWGIYNVPINYRGLYESFSSHPMGIIEQVDNDFGEVGYTGPMPEKFSHTYRLTVYAMAQADLGGNLTTYQFQQYVKGALASASLKVYFAGE